MLIIASSISNCESSSSDPIDIDSRKCLADFILAPRYSDRNASVDYYIEHQLAPSLRQMSDYRWTQNNDIELVISAWKLLRIQVRNITRKRLSLLEPALSEFLDEAQVSSQCLDSTRKILIAAERLESWAIQREYDSNFYHSYAQ